MIGDGGGLGDWCVIGMKWTEFYTHVCLACEAEAIQRYCFSGVVVGGGVDGVNFSRSFLFSSVSQEI